MIYNRTLLSKAETTRLVELVAKFNRILQGD